MSDFTLDDLEHFAPNAVTLPKLMAAEKAGNLEEIARLRREMIYDADSLLVMRDGMGVDWIKKHGLNTSEAERVYGPNWETYDVHQ